MRYVRAGSFAVNYLSHLLLTRLLLPLLRDWARVVNVEGVTGRYFDGKREARANRQAYDERARDRLWALSEDLCGPFLEPIPHRS